MALVDELGRRRPVMVLLELLSRRWALRVLWELREGPLTSRALRAACEQVSPAVLQTRVHELREAGLVALLDRGGYALTAPGTELLDLLLPLSSFAGPWAQGLLAAECRRPAEADS